MTHAYAASSAAPARRPRAEPTFTEMSAAGLRAFFKIAHDWDLSADEQIVLLGSPGRSTFFKWKQAPESARLGRDTLERLSLLLGIYKALQILLPQPAAADAWVKRPNSAPPFGGRRALDRMLAGNISDLVAVRQYLDAMRGGWA
ncbi:antitoxin Xre/MbcA/ParS toxin-binding domain-containing protein [Paraburkholderia sp.]|uniref:MbcA/ParS/Xre antitoxin family protein n=1 Tax=Paraburkholderia sp. TaxID=1926495 RepID=UPI00345DE7FA